MSSGLEKVNTFMKSVSVVASIRVRQQDQLACHHGGEAHKDPPLAEYLYTVGTVGLGKSLDTSQICSLISCLVHVLTLMSWKHTFDSMSLKIETISKCEIKRIW